MRIIHVAAPLIVLSTCASIEFREPGARVAELVAKCAAYTHLGDLDQADVFCDHALSFDDHNPEALNNKGLIAQRRGKREQAKKFFVWAIRASNDSMAQAYLNLGVLALEDGDPSTARDRFRRALRINPDYAEALHDLGLASMRLNELAEAEKAFRTLIVVVPEVSQGYAGVGAVMLLTSRPKEALGWFDQAIGLERDYPEAWRGKGTAYLALGQHDDAREAFESCLEYAPGDVECQTAAKELEALR